VSPRLLVSASCEVRPPIMCHSYQVTFACGDQGVKLMKCRRPGIRIEGRKSNCPLSTSGMPHTLHNQPCGNKYECTLSSINGFWKCCSCLADANTGIECSRCGLHDVCDRCPPGEENTRKWQGYQRRVKQELETEWKLKVAEGKRMEQKITMQQNAQETTARSLRMCEELLGCLSNDC
jgi:hypothetical protein